MDETGNFHDSVYSGDDEKRAKGHFENIKISQNDKDSNEALIDANKNDAETQNRASKTVSRKVGSKLSGVPLDMNETQKRAENEKNTQKIEEVTENQRNGLEGGNSSIEVPSAATENEAGFM